VKVPGLECDVARVLVDGAHQACPYSKATRGNIDVQINVVRASAACRITSSGKPTQVTRNGTVHGLVVNTRIASGITSQATGDFEVETWTYDFGPNQLMERVRIENGIVVQIDSLGYGHNSP